MGRFDNSALGIDLSYYNQNVSIQTLVDHGVSFILHKISDGAQMVAGSPYDPNTYKDPMVDKRIQEAYEVKRKDGGKGIPVIVYHYVQFYPQKADQDRQVQFLITNLTKSKIPGTSYHAVVLDVEEKTDTNTNIRDKVEAMYAAVAKAVPNLKILFYVRNEYLDTQSPALRDWLSSKTNPRNLWMAQWPWSRKTITWDTFKNFIPSDDVKILTPGYATWKIWQWAGDMSGLEGCSNSLDLNFYNGTVADLYNWLGFAGSSTTPTNPPADPPADDDPGTPTDPGTPVTVDLTETNKLLAQILAELKTANAAKWSITKS